MQSSTEQTSVNTQWTIFKTTLLNAMQEFIPQKQIKPKHCLPWVTQRIRKLIRAKYRLHSKLKHNPRPDTKDKHKQASHTLQKETRKAYWAGAFTRSNIRLNLLSNLLSRMLHEKCSAQQFNATLPEVTI